MESKEKCETVGKRIEFIDIARGIAMMSIILGHLDRPEINRIVYTYDLPIFFLISGYFFDTKSTLKPFIEKKAKALLIPYFACCAIITILSVPKALFLKESTGAAISHWIRAALYGAGDNWERPFHIEAIGALWFLWALFWALLVLKLLLNAKTLIRISVVLIYFAFGILTWQKGWLPLSIQTGGPAILYVYIGYLLRQFMSDENGFCKKYSELLAIVGIGLIASWINMITHFTGFWLVHCQIDNGIEDIIGSLGGCLALIVLSKMIERNLPFIRNFLAFFGRYSIILLCVHITELNINPWPKLMEYMPLSDEIYLIILIVLKITIDCAITFVLTKISFVRKVSGLSSEAARA